MIFTKQKTKKFFREAAIPFGLLVLYFILFHFQKLVSLPSQDKFLTLIFDYINHQSVWLIFLIALVEGGFILGQYAPGGVVISLSIISAGTNVPKVILLTSIICLAYFIAYSFDYLLGYYGINKLAKKFGFEKQVNRFKKTLDKGVPAAMLFTYWDTNLASLLAVSAGSLRVPFKKFATYSAIFVVLWNVFWATMLFFFGNIVIDILGPGYLIVLLVFWILWIFYTHFIRKEEQISEEFAKEAA